MALNTGNTLRAYRLRELLPTVGVVRNDVTGVNSTAFIDVPGLSVVVEKGQYYGFDGYIAYNSGTVGDIKFSLSAPAGAPISWGIYGLAQAGTGSVGQFEAFRLDDDGDANVAGAAGSASFGSALMCLPVGWIYPIDYSGIVQFRVSQIAASATPTTIKAGSWLRVTKVQT